MFHQFPSVSQGKHLANSAGCSYGLLCFFFKFMLPNLTNKNTGCLVKFPSQINNAFLILKHVQCTLYHELLFEVRAQLCDLYFIWKPYFNIQANKLGNKTKQKTMFFPCNVRTLSALAARVGERENHELPLL